MPYRLLALTALTLASLAAAPASGQTGHGPPALDAAARDTVGVVPSPWRGWHWATDAFVDDYNRLFDDGEAAARAIGALEEAARADSALVASLAALADSRAGEVAALEEVRALLMDRVEVLEARAEERDPRWRLPLLGRLPLGWGEVRAFVVGCAAVLLAERL